MNQVMRQRSSHIITGQYASSQEEFYLPNEVLQKIFSYMNRKTFLLARSISSMWEEASRSIWKDLYKQTYLVCHSSVEEKPDWKHQFIERNKLLKFHHLGIKKSKSLFKSSYDTNLNKGFEHLYRHELDKALDSFAKAAMERETARAYEGLTRIYYHRKQYHHVIVYSEACLKFSPINPGEILYMRGKALQGLGRLKEALCDINGSVHYLCLSHVKYMNLRAVEVYYDKMLLNITMGNFDAALKDCKKIEQIKTKSSEYSEDLQEDTYLKCAKLLYEKKLYQQAERFLSLSPEKSQDFYLFCMKVQVAIGSYEDALDFFFKFEDKCKLDGNTTTHSISHDTYLDIGITLFMNYEIKTGIEYFVKSLKSLEKKEIKDETIEKAKTMTWEAAMSQNENSDEYFMTIHTSWSYYYFFLGLIGFFNARIDGPEEHESCQSAITNFTRSITLNPTLPESFFYRAVLKCYLHACLEVSPTETIIPEKLLEEDKRKTRSGRNTRRFNQIIGNKIITLNLLRESLNDLTNSLALSSIAKNVTTLPMYISLLKTFVLICLQREKDAAVELEKCIKLDVNVIFEAESAGLKAAITKNEQDRLIALELEAKKRMICPSFEDKLSLVLLSLVHNLKK